MTHGWTADLGAQLQVVNAVSPPLQDSLAEMLGKGVWGETNQL